MCARARPCQVRSHHAGFNLSALQNLTKLPAPCCLEPGEINSQYLVLETRREDGHINHPACACPRRTGAAAEVRRSELPAEEQGGLKVRFHSCPQLPVMKIPVMKIPTRVLVIQEENRSVQRALTRITCLIQRVQPLWIMMASSDISNIHIKYILYHQVKKKKHFKREITRDLQQSDNDSNLKELRDGV